MKKLNIERGKNILRVFLIFLAVICVTLSLNTTAQAAKTKNKFVTKSGKTYYYNAKGKKVKGLKKIKGKYYYFNSKGVLFKKGWKTVKGNKYYFAKKTGAAKTGIAKIGKKKYLFSTKGKRYGTGLVTYKNKRYYTKKGVIQTGLKKVSGNTYFFATSGAAKTGWYTYKGSKYFFGSNGAAYTGIKTINGVNYQFDSNGKFIKVIANSSGGSGGSGNSGSGSGGSGSSDGGGSGNSGLETTGSTEPATLFDSWEVEAAINRFNNRLKRFSENNLTLTNATKTIVNQLNANTVYPDMVTNYSKYTKGQMEAAVNKIDAMTSSLKVNVELVYYPELSKALFNTINTYRSSLSLSNLTWSDQLSKTARLESGYYCYMYPQGYDLNEHHSAQISSCCYDGLGSISGALEGWQNSSMHRPLLVSGYTYGAVAYYSCNDEDGGMWSKTIFTAYVNGTDVSTHCPSSYESLILNCKTSSAIYQ